MQHKQYDESQIQILEGLEPVRKRPGMYIGSTDLRGLHHLIYEVVDNAIDEAMAGFCDEVYVTINHDGSACIRDNGRGIPTGIHPQAGVSTLTVALTMLHAGGKFGGDGYKVSGGLHGVGVSVVNALSSRLVATVKREGNVYRQEFERGNPTSDLTIIGRSEETGTIIEFWPDEEIFDKISFVYDTLKVRLREMAFLNKGIKIVLTDNREEVEQKHSFHYEGGIQSFVEYLNKNKKPLFAEPAYFCSQKGTSIVEVALQYNDGYQETIYSYANNISKVILVIRASVYRIAAALSPSTDPKFPCPSTSMCRIEKSCAKRTIASYTAVSPCGWYFPNTSPTIRALLRYGLSGYKLSSLIEYNIRRCTGFNPSLTSGSARLMITAIAYAIKDFCISRLISIGTIFFLISVFTSFPRFVPSLYIQILYQLGIFFNKFPARLYVISHQYGKGVFNFDLILHLDLQ
jgi:hypothetical protein